MVRATQSLQSLPRIEVDYKRWHSVFGSSLETKRSTTIFRVSLADLISEACHPIPLRRALPAMVSALMHISSEHRAGILADRLDLHGVGAEALSKFTIEFLESHCGRALQNHRNLCFRCMSEYERMYQIPGLLWATHRPRYRHRISLLAALKSPFLT
jgi:hypothetical protein